MWQREYRQHPSAALGRTMEFLVHGHGGAPVLVFPTSRGRFFQWEDFHMTGALGHQLENGFLQLFCVDGIDNETWYNFDRPQADVLRAHQAYDRYLAEEFVPEIRRWNGNPFLIATGTSFGAYQAANFTFRHPSLVSRLVAMSGDFCIRKYVDGHYDQDVYFNNPVDYLPGVTDEGLLSALRQVETILAVGESDFCLDPTRRLSGILHGLGIGHRFDVWSPEWIHDWPTWRQMVQVYL